MYRFLVTRAIGMLFVLLCVTFITFIFGYLAPGDPIKTMMGLHFNAAVYAALKHQYGLDLPWWQQYLNFIINILHGTFGFSFQYQSRQAWDVLKDGLPYSLELGFYVLVLQLVLGIPTGIIAALRSATAVDTIVTSTAIFMVAVPDLVMIVGFQVLMVFLYKNNLPSLPIAGWDTWQSRIAPVVITATTGFGYFTRLTKNSVLEVLGMDYVRTARAKGLRENVVVYRHALRNAMIPLVTVVGPSLAFLVTGIFITEQFFNIPGMSAITLTAISQRDYPVIQAVTVLTSASVVIFNAITDVAYAIVDPRIRVE